MESREPGGLRLPHSELVRKIPESPALSNRVTDFSTLVRAILPYAWHHGEARHWYRFWLQGYERSKPEDPEQYARWRELRKLQEENDAKDKAAKEKAVAVPVN